MTYPGLGGQQPPPQNSAPAGQLVPGVQPGTTAAFVQLRAGNTVINASGIFTYSGTPAAGNLISTETPAAGTDGFGNIYLQGSSAYGSSFATSINGGFLTLYTGTLAGGWTVQATIQTDALGDLLLTAAIGRSVSTANNTLDDGSGNASVSGTLTAGALTVGGSPDTGTAGLTDGSIINTSGPASAGTAHTHSAGTYHVSNAQHVHPF